MLAIAIIVFREVLEAALITSIVLAASYGVAGRGRWVAGGVLGGVIGAGLVASFAASIAEAFQGSGQELLNAAVLILAVCMLGWHNIWMATHARAITGEAKALGREVASGQRPLAALAMITGAATLREGAETVLFVFSVAASSPEGTGALVAGGIIGVAGGVAFGVALYFGLLRIPVRRLFAVTGWMVLLLAGGLASQAAGFLVQADVLPPLGQELWNTSSVLTENSVLGRILHTLIGYTARPQGLQVVAFALTIATIGLAAGLVGRAGPRTTAATAMLVVTALTAPLPARAELKVRLPTVEFRELEFEHNGLVTFGPKGSTSDRAQSYTNEIEYGITPWWMLGIEGEMASGGGQHLIWNAITFENTFQLTEPGEYAFNLGFFAEYSQGTVRGSANSVKFGPIIQKELPDTLGLDTRHTLNVLFSREVGAFAGRATTLDLAWQSVIRFTPLLAPGFEYYGTIDDLGHAGRYNQQRHFVGPVLTGAQSLAPFGKIRYEVGYLFGLSTATPSGAVRWRLEYEVAF